jgi:hypothetical protein
MRRLIVPLSLLAAAAAIWTLGAASPATAIVCPGTSPHIVPCCPVSPGSTLHMQPVCCLTTVCCQPATCCATGSTAQPVYCPPAGCCTPPCVAGTLTIASSPNPSNAGRKVVISGGLTGSTVSGAQVVLWRELAGQSTFDRMSQTTTDGSGHYAFTLGSGSVMTDQAWYVTSDGLKSATIQQHVGALVGLSPSARSTTVGRTIRLTGHVTPSHAGEVVLVEASRGGTWRVIGRPRLGRGSTYAVSERFSRRGTVRLRAVLPGDTRNEQSSSPTLTISVKP